LISLEEPERNHGDAEDVGEIVVGAEYERGRPFAGVSLDERPDAKAAHGLAGEVEAVGVDGEFAFCFVERVHDHEEDIAGTIEVGLRPGLADGTLRDEDEGGKRVLDFAGNPEVRAELIAAGELLDVVGAAAVGAVKKEDEGVFAVGVVAERDKEAVVEALVLRFGEGEFTEVDVVLGEFGGGGGRDEERREDRRQS